MQGRREARDNSIPTLRSAGAVSVVRPLPPSNTILTRGGGPIGGPDAGDSCPRVAAADEIFSVERSGAAPAGEANDPRRDGAADDGAIDNLHVAPARARTAAAFGPGEDVAPSAGLDACRVGGQGGPPACDGTPVHTPSAASVPPVSGAGTPAVPEPSSGTASPFAALDGEPLCRPSRTWAMLGLAAAVLVAVLAMVVLVGCTPRAELHDATRTRFGPPTTAPSVTPAARAALASNDAAGTLAGDASARAAGLTPENLAAEKPLLLDDLGRLAGAIRDVGNRLATTIATAAANDAAVKGMAKERDDARALVRQREGERDEAIRQRDEATAGLFRWIWVGCVALGVIAVILGVIVLVRVSPADLGLAIAGGGVLAICLGLAGSRYGRELAIAGLGLLAVILVVGVWAVIQRLRGDAVSIAEGVEHAIDAGAVDMGKAAKFFRTAQTQGAAKLVGLVKTEGKVAA